MHVIAFNFSINPKTLLHETKMSASNFTNLEKISNQKDLSRVFESGHWNESYIPNDIMTPVSRLN